MPWVTEVASGGVASAQGAVVRRREDAQWSAVGSAQWAYARAARYAQSVRTVVRRCPCVLRQIIGAPDYERYLEHHARCHAGTEPLGRRAYYADFVSWRFGPGPTRCC